MKHTILFATLVIVFSIVLIRQKSVLQLCQKDTCPFCFGDNLCEDFDDHKISLQYDTFLDFTFNLISVKNVFFARYGKEKVVLKKLVQDGEIIANFKPDDVNHDDIIRLLTSGESFKVCDGGSAKLFVNSISYKDIRNVYTILQVNAQPFLLEIFNARKGWPVPKLHGFCGRLVVEENCGTPLNHWEDSDWFIRAYLAYQILGAAVNFTINHRRFRLYLTDISPDNIVVSDGLRICFVDLENAMLARKSANDGITHYTEHFMEESYVYSEEQVCGSTISDHNIYAVCRLIISKDSPWPMSKGGLLHSPPKDILDGHYELFKNIEMCVYSDEHISRFVLSNKILQELEIVLFNYTNYLK